MPLLIGGATTSRVHTAVKIHPNYQRGQAVYVTDASRAVGVAVVAAVARSGATAYVADIRAEYAQDRRGACARRRPTRSGCRSPPRAPTRSSSTGRQLRRRRSRHSSARALFDELSDLAELVAYIDWTPFFQTWELTGRYPAILDDDKCRRGRARAVRRARKRCSTRIVDGELVHGRAPSSASGRPTPSATTSRSTPTTARTSDARDACTRCASSSRAARGPRQCRRSPISSRRATAGVPTISAASPSPPASARTRSPTRFKRANDDYSAILVQGAGRPPRRGLRRAHARARAQGVLGLRAGRDAAPATS